MARYFRIILSFLLVGIAISMGTMINCHKSMVYGDLLADNNKNSEIFDGHRSDVESYIEASGSGKTTLPELINSMPSPSVRLVSSQKRTQQNISAFLMLKHLSSEVTPTNKYNKHFSLPLSAKENLIVIINHLIISELRN